MATNCHFLGKNRQHRRFLRKYFWQHWKQERKKKWNILQNETYPIFSHQRQSLSLFRINFHGKIMGRSSKDKRDVSKLASNWGRLEIHIFKEVKKVRFVTFTLVKHGTKTWWRIGKPTQKMRYQFLEKGTKNISSK